MKEDKKGSYFLTGKEIFQCNGRNPSSIAVYTCLCFHADAVTGECFPSQKVIASECGIKSVNTVKKAINFLIDAGLIKKRETYTKNELGKVIQSSNIYKRKPFNETSYDKTKAGNKSMHSIREARPSREWTGEKSIENKATIGEWGF